MAQTYQTISGSDQISASRQKLVDRDDALRSNFSGASAPSSPVDGQLWRDQTLNMLKMWDGSAYQGIPLGVPVPVAQGGTGATTAPNARTALGLGSLATLSAVGSSQITDGSLTSTKYATGSIPTAAYADASVTGAKLASGAAVANIGYTPVQRGGGPGQDAAQTVRIGAGSGGTLLAEVNGTDKGTFVFASDLAAYMPKSGGAFTGSVTRSAAGSFLYHSSASMASGSITVSTSAPSGGADGDIWFQI